MKYGFCHNIKNGVHYLSVPSFDSYGGCMTCFSTRLGGVSAPPLSSMNLGFGRGDERMSVLENYKILGRAAGFPADKTVAFTQVHRDDVFRASAHDAGEAFAERKREFDAVITNETDLPIATYHADCTPIILFDPVKRAVGAVHAGWRGTAAKIPLRAVNAMVHEFKSNPEDILAAIGPSIDFCCFETDRDVPAEVEKSFGCDAFDAIRDDGNGKFHVSLPLLNSKSLIESGVRDENITLSDECTCCNSELYWSHRKTHGVRGAMISVIMLRGETL